MSSDIKPGDLVMVVRPISCCGNLSAIGKVLTVDRKGTNGCYCPHCMNTFPQSDDVLITSNGRAYHRSRLKKIDPPALDESVERVQELETA